MAASRIAVHGVRMSVAQPCVASRRAISSGSSGEHTISGDGVVVASTATVVALDVVPSGIGASSGAGSTSCPRAADPRPYVRLPCGLVNGFAGPVVPEV